jgi:hypothetical protein
MMTTCWVVSPMLRDTESFIRLRADISAACTQRTETIRYLVIDDSAGTDTDVVRLSEFDDVEVLTPAFNLGHQRAIVFGLRELAPRLAPDDLVVTMDSDGEDQPGDVPRLLRALDDGPVALALAERTTRSEGLRFRVMYLFFRAAFRILTGTTVKSGNFAAQRADSLQATIHHPSFDLCYSSTLLELKRATTLVPCARGSRYAGESRMSTYSLMAHGVRMLLPMAERIAVRMMIVSVLSGVALLIGLLCGALGLLDGIDGNVRLALLGAKAMVFVASFTAFVVLFSSFARPTGPRRV